VKTLIVLVISCLLLVACASKPPKKTENPGDLYVEGVNFMKAKKYDKAVEKFSQIRDNFPFDPMSLIATVKLADVYFEKQEYVLAVGVYEDFFNAHPEDENVPYVLARAGECYEKLSLSSDRDQMYTLKAMEKYTYLKNRYPKSTYAVSVDAKLKALIQKLANRELYVGEFYYRTSQYNAAITRLEYVSKKFPEMQGMDKVLYYLAMSYKELGDLAKSDYYFDRLKKEYPKSVQPRPTTRERKQLQLAKGESARVPASKESKKKEIDLRPPVPKSAQDRQGSETPSETMVSSDKGKDPDQKAQVSQAGKDAKGSEKTLKEKEDEFGFDKTKPIDIVSDTMEGFDKEKYVVFKGSVIAKQEDLFIFADRMEAYMSEDSNGITKAYAKDNVKILKKDRTATCNEALFDNTKGEIVLKGNVIVFSGQDKLAGDVVTYYLHEDRVVVQGEQEKKARVILNPK